MKIAQQTLKAIDETLEANQESSHRKHLGASGIGNDCARQIWYSFRWVKSIRHKAATLRLFNRGHLEEYRFIEWLKNAGIEVDSEIVPGMQHRFSDCEGHFGGSLDGVGRGIPDLGMDAWCLLEFKTHGEKSYKELLNNGVEISKPVHNAQMQTYMYEFGLKYALYLAINKNTDQIYAEIIDFDEAIALKYVQRANDIIFSDEPPLRISNDRTFYKCKWCDFYGICHGFDALEINCRTCAHVSPTVNGKWQCEAPNVKPFVVDCVACPKHVFNPHLFNGVTKWEGRNGGGMILTFADGSMIIHAPDSVPSKTIHAECEKLTLQAEKK